MVALFLSASACLYAQERKISGQIVDENGEPIIGASIVVEGTKGGTISDLDGNFSINVPAEGKLQVSYIGYVTQILTPKNSTLKIVLQDDTETLDEVVVVGYGTQKMKNVTGAITTVAPKELEQLPVSNLGAALNGVVPGLNISGGEARPGVAATMTIRNPQGDDKTPLFVIDDFVSTQDAFNNLDPQEIESISILKDASAAIYGARSSQGAVLVKTKRGHNGVPKINYSFQLGVNDAISQPKMLSAYDYGVFYNRYAAADPDVYNSEGFNKRTALFQADELETMKGLHYDWLDEAWHPAVTMKHNVTISGGTERATYFAGVSYFQQNGNLSTLDYDRWNYRAGVDVKLTPHLKVNLQISGDRGKRRQTFNKIGKETDENDYLFLSTTPYYIPWEIDGRYIRRSGLNHEDGNFNKYNFFAIENGGDTKENRPVNFQMNASVEYDFDWSKILKGLKVKLSYTDHIYSNHYDQIGTHYDVYYFGTRTGSGNHLYEKNIAGQAPISDEQFWSTAQSQVAKNGDRLLRDGERTQNYQLNFTVTYNRTFGQHTVGALFGIERAESWWEKVRYYKDGMLDNELNTGQSNSATGSADGQTLREESGMLSYIGRLNYSYADKYLFEFLIRSDASTKFAPENYWGTFPSFSAGWVMSEENWFKNRVKWVDFLKIRASVGFLGKDNTAAWAWMQRYTYQNNKGAVFGTDPASKLGFGIKTEAAPNREAHWDKSDKYNLGIDARFLNSRLTVNWDVYYDINREMLVSRDASVPVTIGTALAKENYDRIDAFGTELSVTWRDNIADVNYYVGLSTAFSDTRLKKRDMPDIIGYKEQHLGQSTDLGKWAYKCLGMFRSQADIDAYVQQYGITKVFDKDVSELRPGMLYYKDVRGQQNADGTYGGPDGVIDENDMVRFSRRSTPPYNFTLRFGGNWKGLSLSAQLGCSWGNFDMLTSTARNVNTSTLEYTNVPAFWRDMFIAYDVKDDQGNVVAPANTDAKYPNMNYATFNGVESDFWEINSFRLELKNISLGYTLPKQLVNSVGVEGCKLSLTANNVCSFFNPYPEHFISAYGNYGNYPVLRTISFGLNVSF